MSSLLTWDTARWVFVGMIWLVSTFLAGFIFWSRLRADYKEEEVLSMSWYILVAAVIGGLIGRLAIYEPQAGIIFGGLVALIWFGRKSEINAWEEADILGVLMLALGVILNFSLGRNRLIMAGFMLLGLALAIIVKKNYRRFRWYKSGKPGVVGLFGLLWWSMGELGIAFLVKNKLYWGGLTPAQWLAVAMIPTIIVVIYTRALGKNIWPKWRFNRRRQSRLS